MTLAINPIRIQGRWRDGFALDYHTVKSTFIGYNEFGHPEFETERSPIGEALYDLKYNGDRAKVDALARMAAMHVRLWKPEIDCVVPVPASRARSVQPVSLVGRALTEILGVPFGEGWVRRTKDVPELKNIREYDQRLSLLNEVHEIDSAKVLGKNILLFDDLYRSGATMNAITAALYDQGGASNVFALTLTRTRVHQ